MTGTRGRWFEIALTSFIKTERAAGRKVITLILEGIATNGPYAIFNSDEAPTNQPELVISRLPPMIGITRRWVSLNLFFSCYGPGGAQDRLIF